MLVGTKHKLSSITTASIELGNTSVPLSNAVKYLGVIIDNTLSMKKIHHPDLSVVLLSVTAY